MLFALIVATLSVVLGAALGLTRSWDRRVLGPVRTFALMASLGAITLHLLPEAFELDPGWAVVCFILGLTGPPLLKRTFRYLRPQLGTTEASRVGLAATFIGLLGHRFADGLAIGSFSGSGHEGQARIDVMLALSAHTVPVVAIFVLALVEVRSISSVLAHAVALAAASILGVALGPSLAGAASERGGALLAAAVAGLLLHVVASNLGADPPSSARERATDFFAAAAGLAVSLFGNDAHHGVDAARDVDHTSFAEPLWRLSLETAPLLMLGLAAGAALQALGSKIPKTWLIPRNSFVDALRGSLVGAPLPLCSCSVLPVSSALQSRRASAAFVVAFLFATPELGIETFALSVRFFGWPFAWLRLVGALAIAFIAAVTVSAFARPRAGASISEADVSVLQAEQSWHRSFFLAFDDLLYHVGAWMLLGLVAAAFLQATLPSQALVGLQPTLLELAVVSLISIPSYICASSATPLAAVLIAKGMSPGAALVALLLGPATNLATLVFLRTSYGLRATAFGLGAVLAGSWLLASLTNHQPMFAASGLAATAPEHDFGALTYLATTLLGLLIVRNIWRFGARHWLAGLVHHATHGGTHGHHHHRHDRA